MFHESSALLINKIDLLSYVNADVEKIKAESLKINPNLDIFEVSGYTEQGLTAWYDWIVAKVKQKNDSSN